MNETGMDEITLDKALKKMTAKELSVLAYKGLQRHVENCEAGQQKVVYFLKILGTLVGVLALERLGEIFHIPLLSTIVTHVTGTGI